MRFSPSRSQTDRPQRTQTESIKEASSALCCTVGSKPDRQAIRVKTIWDDTLPRHCDEAPTGLIYLGNIRIHCKLESEFLTINLPPEELDISGNLRQKKKARVVKPGPALSCMDEIAYLMKSISRYVGSGQRSSATIVSSLSADSRIRLSAVKICSRAYFA